MIDPNASDEALLADRTDPAESFALLYRRHATAVLRFVAGRGATADQAAEVVAETFLAALRGRYRYRPRQDTALPWLTGIAQNKLADAQRREFREARRAAVLADHLLTLTDADREGYAELVASSGVLEALDELPEAERVPLRARIVDEDSYAEIAERLNIGEAAARKRVSRGLARMRTRMEKP